MSNSYEFADADYEASDWPGDSDDAYDESDEGWGEARRRQRPVRTSTGRNTYSPRPSGASQPVTQAQLQAALARVSQQITVNSGAIKTLDGRVRGVAADQNKLSALVRKDSAERKKGLDTVRRDLQQTRELSALIPLVTYSDPTGPLARLAPLLFLLPSDALNGGSSSSSPSTGSSDSLLGGSNLLAIAAIAMASGAIPGLP
jgi:hypothetical protein